MMKSSGFTLIELLVVVIIMGVLTALALPQYRRAMDRSKAAEAMQMLPAFYEARERWVIEHQCTWSSGSITSCEEGTFSAGKLDIESKGEVSDTDNTTVKTPNFVYNLVNKGTSSLNQACVSATPRWGANRNLTSAVIWYRGDKFSCNGNSDACDILNVTPDGDRYRQGCI